MFFEQLLLPQIMKAPKRQSSQQCCFALLGLTSVKAARRMLMELTPNLICVFVFAVAFVGAMNP
jgi:hypothetical protein